ncbi:MAG: hypothetical protein QOG68_1557 [Solirubrobacteraceae bacterium]|nr:hypothetical protein [Solirubrobacteraceae bacterium]
MPRREMVADRRQLDVVLAAGARQRLVLGREVRVGLDDVAGLRVGQRAGEVDAGEAGAQLPGRHGVCGAVRPDVGDHRDEVGLGGGGRGEHVEARGAHRVDRGLQRNRGVGQGGRLGEVHAGELREVRRELVDPETRHGGGGVRIGGQRVRRMKRIGLRRRRGIGSKGERSVVDRVRGPARRRGEIQARPPCARQRPVAALEVGVVSGEQLLTAAVGEVEADRRLAVDAVVDAAHEMVEPAGVVRERPAAAGGRAVVRADDQQVAALVAGRPIGQERAAQLDVVEAGVGEHGDVRGVALVGAVEPERVLGRVRLDVGRRGCVALEAVGDALRLLGHALGEVLQPRREDGAEDVEARRAVLHPADVEQVAVEVDRSGHQRRGPDAGKGQVHRVVDRDRTGREPVEADPAVAPRLLARPGDELREILLVAQAGGGKGAAAAAGAPPLQLDVVVGRTGDGRAARRRVGAVLDDQRTPGDRALAADRCVEDHAVVGRERQVLGDLSGAHRAGADQRGKQRGGQQERSHNSHNAYVASILLLANTDVREP